MSFRAFPDGSEAELVLEARSFWVQHAIEEIFKYDRVVTQPKWKTLHKFGENPAVGSD